MSFSSYGQVPKTKRQNYWFLKYGDLLDISNCNPTGTRNGKMWEFDKGSEDLLKFEVKDTISVNCNVLF